MRDTIAHVLSIVGMNAVVYTGSAHYICSGTVTVGIFHALSTTTADSRAGPEPTIPGSWGELPTWILGADSHSGTIDGFRAIIAEKL
jgi:hypothetical protein